MASAVLLIDHGSRRPGANDAIGQLAALMHRQRPGVIVRVAHLDFAPPTIAEGLAACVAAGATEVVVHPFFLASGVHVVQDIPRQVAAAAAAHPGLKWRVTEPLGVHERLAEVVWERVEERTRVGQIGGPPDAGCACNPSEGDKARGEKTG